MRGTSLTNGVKNMKIMKKCLSAMGILLALACAPALALADETAEKQEEVTLTGKLLCARCALKEDRKGCQDALMVEGEGGGLYYLEKNGVADQFGHPCEGKWDAEITGVVSERDGKTWITARKMVKPEKKD